VNAVVSDLANLREDGPVNVFMLDHDPRLAARYHCDKHVVKMIVETAQLLSTAWHCLANAQYMPLADDPADDPVTPWFAFHVLPPTTGTEQPPVIRKSEVAGEAPDAWWLLHGQRIYRRTHERHPSAIWAQELGGNYLWLWRLGMFLCQEHVHRFGKHHKTEPVLWTLEGPPPALLDTVDQWTECPPVVPDECKVIIGDFYDTVASYRLYYNQKKLPIARYTNRDPPAWLGAV
jgi:hypothetical protein